MTIVKICILFAIIYLVGVVFTLIFLNVVRNKVDKYDIDIKMDDSSIAISSIFWFYYWYRYIMLGITLKKLINEYQKKKDEK